MFQVSNYPICAPFSVTQALTVCQKCQGGALLQRNVISVHVQYFCAVCRTEDTVHASVMSKQHNLRA